MIIMALFTMSMVQAGNLKDGSDNVDADKSKVEWKGEKVTGEHVGTINAKSGNLDVKNGKLVGGSFVMDMTSIVVSDLDGEYKGKLEGHLKSDDFFGVSNFPEAVLTIKKAKESSKAGTYAITADLTIKGITNPIEFNATLIENNGGLVANSNIIIDRTKYDIKYGSGSFFDDLGDKTIYDEFTLTVNLVTK